MMWSTAWCCRRIVRGIFLLLTSGSALALEAEFKTTRGDFIVDLHPDKTPLAVTHFVDLAEGRRTWVDPLTGSVRIGGFYNGKGIHRVVSTSSERFFETGAFATGGTDPGYGYPDEFHPDASHQPYVMAMANDGPNTNGTGIQITGSLAMPHRNGRHTVLGRVREGQGRSVVDAILAAGANASVIREVIIRGREPWKETLEAGAQKLPTVSGVKGSLHVTPGVASELLFSQRPNSVLTAHASVDLSQWAPHYRRFCDSSVSLPVPLPILDDASLASRFYHLAVIDYPTTPSSPGFSSLIGRRVVIEGENIATIVYVFDQTGKSGKYENLLSADGPPFFSGTFSLDEGFPVKITPCSLQFLVNTPGFGGSPRQLVKLGWDTGTISSASGRHETQVLNQSMEVIFIDRGYAGSTR
ncbi:MAG: peptidylprolyl isomerase [Verrucomicrobiaceae bacterium]|nr:MAG: peptidylprolyl isomerase [Verrucomicrobiaceae bacterium]